MRELDIPTRALAERISTAKSAYAHTTVWAWLRNTEGAPPKATYTNGLNRKLAEALQLTPDVLAKAFQESRSLLILGNASAGTSGPLSVLRQMFEDSRKETWSRKELVKLIDDLRGK